MSDSIIQVSPNYEVHHQGRKAIIKRKDGQKYEFEDKEVAVKICQDRITGWFFKPAEALIAVDHTVAAIHLITFIIEALQSYKEGKQSTNKSQNFFDASARVIFKKELENYPNENDKKSIISLLYEGVRCGFYHQGFLRNVITKNDSKVKNKILISSENGENEAAISYNTTSDSSIPVCELIIYSRNYLNRVKYEFTKFFEDVESDPNKLENFWAVWKEDWQMKGDKDCSPRSSTR